MHQIQYIIVGLDVNKKKKNVHDTPKAAKRNDTQYNGPGG